jgi:hypothetical protein
VPNAIGTIKEVLIEKGPLSVAMGLGSDFGGYFDGNGIYRCSDDSDVNHAVVITGYGETGDYWIVKNSWGNGWNGDGYFKVGYGECAIETLVYYANHTDGVNCKALTIFNEGDGYLDVDGFEIQYQLSEPTGWLDADPKSFMVSPGGSKRVSVCVNCTGLSPGEYHGWLNITSNDPDEDPYAVTVRVCWPDNCTICYNVTNIGNGTASAGHNTTLFVEGVEAAYDPVDAVLEPNESYIGCFDGYNWIYTPPNDNITVCADNNNTVAEIKETNNCMFNTWKCGDVDGNGIVNIMDVRLLMNHVADLTRYPIDPWAGDVEGEGDIDDVDVQRLLAHVFAPEAHPLECRGD